MSYEHDDTGNEHSGTELNLSRRGFITATGGTALLTSLGVGQARAAREAGPTFNAEVLAQLAEYIENPPMVAENQDPAHVPIIPHPSVGAVRGAQQASTTLGERQSQSPFYQSLNGEWNFHFAYSPSEAPDDIGAIDDWETITVPRNWQTEGYGHEMYRNIPLDLYPYDPPQVPDDLNPVGTYNREFTVSEDWTGERQTFLRFEGVKAAYFVWANGEYVGYDEGSMTPGEFDVTDHLSAGNNSVTVRVYRWADGSYLENQDMWHFAGIYRDVYLYSTPSIYVQDYFTQTLLDDEYKDGRLQIDAEITNTTAEQSGPYTVRAHLYDLDRKKVTTFEETASVAATATNTVQLCANISDPAKWSAEKPHLYELAIELVAPNGETTEAVADRVGFRKFEVVDNQVLVNGEPTTFKGVNRHEHHPDYGRHVPVGTMREDLEVMKQFNVSAVRCSHYPNSPEFYYLCDEYGFYVVDEVNAETHQNTTLVNDYPAFKPSFLDRFTRMVQRDKNYASIFAWSTGNEAGLGPAHFEMAEYVNRVDETRILYHQSTSETAGGESPGQAPYTPVVGPRYPSPSEMEELATNGEENRPAIMGEYNHAMGNSLGLVHRFWELIDEYDQLQGGFIWDWVNQSLNWDLLVTPDESPAGNDGVVMNNPAIVDGQNDGDGDALALSGLDDWVELYRDPSLDITEPGLTVKTTAKPRTPWTGDSPFLTKGQQYGLTQREEGTVEFYVKNPEDGERVVARAPVPTDWIGSWHQVAGVYDGTELTLYIDGEVTAKTPYDGEIEHVPFPVNVGRNSQIHREQYQGWLSNAIFDSASVYERALSAEELRSGAPSGCTVLDLEFEKFRDEGTFSSYGVSPFCCNGVVFGDRTPQPELSQLKKSHQSIKVEAVDLSAGRICVRNKHDFTGLEEYDASWQLQADGEVIQKGDLDLTVPPGGSETLTVPFERPTIKPGTTYWLTVQFTLASDEQWADADHEIAFEQFEMPFNSSPALTDVEELPAVTLERTDDGITAAGADGSFQYVLDPETGTLTSMRYCGEEYLQEGPLLNAWRTPISNERVAWGAAEAEEWRAAGLNELDHHIRNVSAERVAEGVVRFHVEAFASAPENPAGFETTYTYHVLGTGDVLLGARVVPNNALQETITHWLPRIGVDMEHPDRLEGFSWYGNGPHETYPDRKWGARTDVYEETVAEQYVPYIRPQDHGNKTETRWAALTDRDENEGFAVFGQPKLNASVHRHANLDRALHNYQLKELDGVRFNVDAAVTGVGGTPVQTLPEYRVEASQTYEFVIGLRPFSDEASPEALHGRRLPFTFATTERYGNLNVTTEDGVVRAAATVRNPDATEVTIEVPLVVDSKTVGRQRVTLAGGEKRRITFEVGTDDISEVSVGGLPAQKP